jgi:quercetin dioxygenase-like cupin family protein
VPPHLVIPRDKMRVGSLGIYETHAQGTNRVELLDRAAGSVHVGYALYEMQPGGEVDRCVHAYEKTIFVLSGELQLERDGYLIPLKADDFALVAAGVPHATRNISNVVARWVEVAAPQPKPVGGWQDSFFVGVTPWDTACVTSDLRDPRCRQIGHFDVSKMPPSAFMHGDLQGFSVRRLLDREFGAIHMTMFVVEFARGGICNHHDHPFEEAYLVLDGDVDIVFDGKSYTLRKGDFAWTGVGSRHAFFPVEGRPVRWLEIQAPQPPALGGTRFHSRWEYLCRCLEK